MQLDEALHLFDERCWDAFFEAQAESLDELAPHLRRQVAAHLLNELLEADNHDLNDLSALRLRDE